MTVVTHKPIGAGTLDEFACILHRRRDQDNPPVLLVGAGISIESGGPTGTELKKKTIADYRPSKDDYCAAPENGPKGQDSLYDRIISAKSDNEIYGVFDEYLQYNIPSPGYQAFTRICKRRYFDWIISTNFDPLIEEAFAFGRVPSHDFLVLSRVLADTDRLAQFINRDFSRPRLKLLKIHGDLKFRKVHATAKTTYSFETSLKGAISSLIANRDLVVLGHSVNDKNLQKVIRRACSKSKDPRSLWLLTMSKEETEGHEFLKDIANKYCKSKGSVRYLEPFDERGESVQCKRDAKKWYPSFDDLMVVLDLKLANLENDNRSDQAKSLTDFSEIRHVVGMTVNKRQLLEYVVAPPHADFKCESGESGRDEGFHACNYVDSEQRFKDTQYFDDMSRQEQEKTWKEGLDKWIEGKVSPIFFASLWDSTTASLLVDGLLRNRSDAEVSQAVSDYPHLGVEFVHKVNVSWCKELEVKRKDLQKFLARKGIRALSKVLFRLWRHKNKKEKENQDVGLGVVSSNVVDGPSAAVHGDGEGGGSRGGPGVQRLVVDQEQVAASPHERPHQSRCCRRVVGDRLTGEAWHLRHRVVGVLEPVRARRVAHRQRLR